MIDISVDRAGHSLRMLVWEALRGYRTDRLFRFLRDKDIIVRSVAARELQLRGTRKVFDHVAKLAGDKSPMAREMSAFALGQLGVPKYPFRVSSAAILSRLACTDASASVRSAAVSSLGHLKANRSLGIVIEAAQDPAATVRVSAAFALGCLRRSTEAVRAFNKLARDKDREVREWAKWSLALRKQNRPMLRKLLLAVMATVLPIANAAGEEGSLDVQARLAALAATRIALEFTLRNSGSVPLEFFASDLPWGIQLSLMLVPVTNDPEARRIAEALYVDDPRQGQVTIKAGEQLSGTVDLLHRFPSLPKFLKTREVIVFWSFQPRQVNRTQMHRTSGAVVLPKL